MDIVVYWNTVHIVMLYNWMYNFMMWCCMMTKIMHINLMSLLVMRRHNSVVGIMSCGMMG